MQSVSSISAIFLSGTCLQAIEQIKWNTLEGNAGGCFNLEIMYIICVCFVVSGQQRPSVAVISFVICKSGIHQSWWTIIVYVLSSMSVVYLICFTTSGNSFFRCVISLGKNKHYVIFLYIVVPKRNSLSNSILSLK